MRAPKLPISASLYNRLNNRTIEGISRGCLRREFAYLALILDVFKRAVRGWHLSRRLDHQLALIALEKALSQGKPEIHHSDQGIQYAALPYSNRLREVGVKICMADVGQPAQNPYAEWLIRAIKEEEVYLSEYEDAREVYRKIGTFIEDVYTYKWIHSSLGYLTPMEYELRWVSIQENECISVIKESRFLCPVFGAHYIW